MPEKTPTLIWAQRVDKVFVTFECLTTKDVKVTMTEGLLSLECSAGADTYKLENMSLFMDIIAEESAWKANDRCRRSFAPAYCAAALDAGAGATSERALPDSASGSLSLWAQACGPAAFGGATGSGGATWRGALSRILMSDAAPDSARAHYVRAPCAHAAVAPLAVCR